MNRAEPIEIIRSIFTNTLNLPKDRVDSLLADLENSGELDLAKQRIQTLPAEIMDDLMSTVSFTASDDSIDHVELGDEKIDQMANFYASGVDSTKPTDDPSDNISSSVKDLLARLNGAGCKSRMVDVGSTRISEMNMADANAAINSNTDSDIDPNVKKRIDAMRASGNEAGAENLRKLEMRKAHLKNRQKPRTPIDNVIDAKKRELAQALKRKEQQQNGNAQ